MELPKRWLNHTLENSDSMRAAAVELQLHELWHVKWELIKEHQNVKAQRDTAKEQLASQMLAASSSGWSKLW